MILVCACLWWLWVSSGGEDQRRIAFVLQNGLILGLVIDFAVATGGYGFRLLLCSGWFDGGSGASCRRGGRSFWPDPGGSAFPYGSSERSTMMVSRCIVSPPERYEMVVAST